MMDNSTIKRIEAQAIISMLKKDLDAMIACGWSSTCTRFNEIELKKLIYLLGDYAALLEGKNNEA